MVGNPIWQCMVKIECATEAVMPNRIKVHVLSEVLSHKDYVAMLFVAACFVQIIAKATVSCSLCTNCILYLVCELAEVIFKHALVPISTASAPKFNCQGNKFCCKSNKFYYKSDKF